MARYSPVFLVFCLILCSFFPSAAFAQSCPADDGLCPVGGTFATDRDCADFSTFKESGPLLTRGANLTYYYLWRYREEVYSSGRGHYLNQCPQGGEYRGQSIIKCNGEVKPMVVTDFSGEKPPADKIDAHSFDAGGNEIIIAGRYFWRRTKGQGTWIKDSLVNLWKKLPGGAATSNWQIVPISGIEAFAVEPCGGYGVIKEGKGWWVCADGLWHEIPSLATVWTGQVHPPLTGLDAMEYVSLNSADDCDGDGRGKIYFAGDQIWIQCDLNNPAANMVQQSLVSRWKETEKILVNPPLAGIDAYGFDATSPNGALHFASANDGYWLADNDGWYFRSWESGPDTWLLRDAVFFDNRRRDGKIYLSYDSLTPSRDPDLHHWQNVLAVAESPEGPWQELGYFGYWGDLRWWESGDYWQDRGGSIGGTIFFVDGEYYLFYLAHNTVVENETWSVPGWWDRSVINRDLAKPGAYHLGLAKSASIFGPWKRLNVSGVNNENASGDGVNCAIEGCVISQAPDGEFGWIYAANHGSLVSKEDPYNPTCGPDGENISNPANLPCSHLFLYTAQGMSSPAKCQTTNCWGQGIIYSSGTLLGPWQKLAVNGSPVLVGPKSPAQICGSENNDLFFEEETETWFMFSDAKYCGNVSGYQFLEGNGQMVQWTKNLFNWPENNYFVLNEHRPGGVFFSQPVPNSLKTYLSKDPKTLTQHRGSSGPATILPFEGKLYVVYGAHDFYAGQEDLFAGSLYQGKEYNSNFLFRDLWLSTLDLPLAALRGDFNQDKQVNSADLETVFSYYLTADCRFEIFKDSLVNGLDLVSLFPLLH